MQNSDHSRSGQSLVEFALVFPIMVIGLVFFLDLGRLVYEYSVLSNAAREGARFASALDPSYETEVENYIHQRIPGLDPIVISFTAVWSDCSLENYVDEDGTVKEMEMPGNVVIRLDYSTDSIILGANLPMSATSKMRLEICP